MVLIMPDREQLLAANHSLEEMRVLVEADSLGFLSLEGLYNALGETKRDDDAPQYTDHCFTGEYPTRLVDYDHDHANKNPQLSLLVEVA